MCEYHLGTGDMFKTDGGLGIIVDKKNGNFYYKVVTHTDGNSYAAATSRIPTARFYECLNDGIVKEVYLLPDKKYRRKRNRI